MLADRDDLTPMQLARTRALMDTHVPDALVTGYLDVLPSLTLPDLDDRHVLAAAIVSRATVIITFNLKDFPDDKLALYDCRAVHPDDFLLDLAVHTPDQMILATHAILRRLRNPPVSLDDYFDMLRKIGLPADNAQHARIAAVAERNPAAAAAAYDRNAEEHEPEREQTRV